MELFKYTINQAYYLIFQGKFLQTNPHIFEIRIYWNKKNCGPNWTAVR